MEPEGVPAGAGDGAGAGAGDARVWDVIVVGAGAAGAALAARLSEDPGRRVLLLEAGPVPASAGDFPRELALSGTVEGADPGHPQNWSYPAHLTPDRPYSIARGRIAGGSTTVNGSYFVRARPSDFARWSAGGNNEWTFEAVLPAMRRLEHDLDFGASPLPGAGAGSGAETGVESSAVHGDAGPMLVKRPPQDTPLIEAFTAAAEAAGFAFEADKNGSTGQSGGGNAEGVGPLPMNALDGVRWNTFFAYLEPLRNRTNLTVRGDTAVTRVLLEPEGGRHGRLRATGVEVASTACAPGGPTIIRSRDVVLTAGSIASPHLLLLSGVGPRVDLEAAGVTVVHALEGVGAAFSDHPQVNVDWIPKPGVIDYRTRQSLAVVLNAGDLELMPFLKPTPYLLQADRGSPVLSLLVSLLQERSRGRLRLLSSDPRVPPALDYHYLEDATDRERLRSGVRLAVRLLRSPAFVPVFGRLVPSAPDPAAAPAAVLADLLTDDLLEDDARLDEWILANVGTAIHLSGTAPFGPPGDPLAVVDQYGRVLGIDGLRIADTSILPDAPSRGPAATAVLIGERIAEFMRRP